MKSKKTLLVLLLILLIIGNLVFEFINLDFSSDPNDNKITKEKNKYQFLDDDNKYQIISNCFDTLFSMIDGNEEAGLILTDPNYDNYKNIDNFSIQEIYKLEKDKKGIYYVKMYIIKNDKLSKNYFVVKVNYENYTYSISTISENEFISAKNNTKDKNLNFEITPTEINIINRNIDPLSIPYRYMNDFYIKYKYMPEEAKKILGYYNRQNIKLESFDGISLIDKKINNRNITYNILVNQDKYEIIIKSAMDYEVNKK